jgi:D-glycero-D-manno-heptose 1,7-bisphosphate phosphatase
MERMPADTSPRRPVIFLDRDGVINRKAPEGSYIADWSEFQFLPGAIEALARLQQAGACLLVVTNQRGVARGRIDAGDLEQIHSHLTAELARSGVALEGIYVCPHEAGTCDCRKPDVGLFLEAQREHPWISFEEAHLVADSLSDLEAGQRLGIRLWLVGDNERADYVARQAARRDIRLLGRAPTLLALVADGALLAAAVESGAR